MQIIIPTDRQISDFFVNDPALCYLGLPDQDLVEIYETGSYLPRMLSTYVGVNDDHGQLIAIIQYELFTQVTINGHLFISTAHQKQGVSKDVLDTFYNYLVKEQPQYRKLTTIVPESCPHVKKCAERWGMKKEGVMKKAVIWRTKLEDLTIYAKELKRIK